VVRELLHPNLCTRVSLMVPEMNILLMFASAMLVSLLHSREKHGCNLARSLPTSIDNS
jgi:hypothetical protein